LFGGGGGNNLSLSCFDVVFPVSVDSFQTTCAGTLHVALVFFIYWGSYPNLPKASGDVMCL
jgi:hypothetical protein